MYNMVIIPYREDKKKNLKDIPIDKITDEVSDTVESIWQSYRRFHSLKKDYDTLQDKAQIFIKGYDNNYIDKNIPLQYGDVIITFMVYDLPNDFIRSLEITFAGYRYENRN